MNVYFDTNVLLDVLLHRQPFVKSAEKMWILAERGKIRGQVSVLSFPNIYYIAKKLKGAATAASMLITLRDIFFPVSCTEQVLHQAIDSGMKDFEDAIQYFSALHADASCIVSRNLNHFPATDLQIYTPDEFLTVYSFE